MKFSVELTKCNKPTSLRWSLYTKRLNVYNLLRLSWLVLSSAYLYRSHQCTGKKNIHNNMRQRMRVTLRTMNLDHCEVRRSAIVKWDPKNSDWQARYITRMSRLRLMSFMQCYTLYRPMSPSSLSLGCRCIGHRLPLKTRQTTYLIV